METSLYWGLKKSNITKVYIQVLSFNLYIVAELSWNRIRTDGAQLWEENTKFPFSIKRLKLPFHCCCFAERGKELCQNVCAEPLFCSLKPDGLLRSIADTDVVT